MKRTLKQEIRLPEEAQNIQTTIVGKNVEISFDIEESKNEIAREEIKGTKEYVEKYFPIAKLSTLSLEDEFLKHEPGTDSQRKFKEKLVKAINSGLSDIRVQRMDPSLDENGNICFCKGKMPTVGKSANWWKKKAEEFLPEYGSGMGLTKEKIGCLGLLIKYLVEEKGYTLSRAWKAVCDQSKDLGHFWDSENAKHKFEPTGERQVGDWCDLGNTYKITEDDEASGFSLVGGDYGDDGGSYPLADVGSIGNPSRDYGNGVGWLVLSKVALNTVKQH